MSPASSTAPWPSTTRQLRASRQRRDRADLCRRARLSAGPRRFLFFAAAPGPPARGARSRGARRPPGLPPALRGAEPDPHGAAVLALEAAPGRPCRQRLRARRLGEGRAGRGLADDRRAAHHEDDAGGHGLRLLRRRHRSGRRLPGRARSCTSRARSSRTPTGAARSINLRSRHHRPLDRLEQFFARFLANGNHFPGYLSTDQDLTDEDFEALTEQFKGSAGVLSAGELRIFDRGLKLLQNAMSLKDAQLTRGACAGSRAVLPALPRAAAAAAGLDARHLHQRRAGRHLVRPAHPHAAGRRHRGVDRAAPLPAERDRRRLLHQVQHRLAAARRLRGALAGYSILILCGVLSPNEARAFEDWNPYDGGDEYRLPLNTAPAGLPRSPRRAPVPAADKVKAEEVAPAGDAARNLAGRRAGALRRGHHGAQRRRSHRTARGRGRERGPAGHRHRGIRSPGAGAGLRVGVSTSASSCSRSTLVEHFVGRRDGDFTVAPGSPAHDEEGAS